MDKVAEKSKNMILDRPWFNSYEKGINIFECLDLTLDDVFENTLNDYSKNKAISFFGAELTYSQLSDLINKFAAALIERGVKKGDKIAIQLPNCPQFIIAFYGTLKAGCVAVPINPLYVGKDLQLIIKDSEARIIVTLTKTYPHVKNADTSLRVIIATNIKEYFPSSTKMLFTVFKEKKEGHRFKLTCKESVSWSDFLKFGQDKETNIKNNADELAVIQYTGGTTGFPKGAMLTHKNLVSNIYQLKSWHTDLQMGKEKFICAIPFFHIYGLTTALNLPVLLGSTMILFPQINISQILDSIEKLKPTRFPGIPALYSVINNFNNIEKYDLSSIKYCVSGAAPLPNEVKARFEKLTQSKLIEGYGLTEASPVTHANPINGKHKSCIGLPLPGTDAKIVDQVSGVDLKVKEVGELVIKGPQVMAGYYKAPNETKETIKDGWLFTGDIGYMDDEGYFYIIDRKKDLIISSGFNVYPREIEEVLYGYPGVKEACVVGISHKIKGEVIAAFVTRLQDCNVSEAELKQYCRKNLPNYKIPRQINFIDEIPKTLIGKHLRRELRNKFAEKINGNSSLHET